jgi:hypothetical protein
MKRIALPAGQRSPRAKAKQFLGQRRQSG